MRYAKHLVIIGTAFALIAATAGGALADDEEKKEERMTRGIYAAGGGGVNFQSGESAKASWRFLAAARPWKYLSVELGYLNLDENKNGDKLDGFSFGGVPTYPIGQFDIYGKAGFVVSTIDGNTEIRASYGAGAAWWWKRIGTRFEFERYEYSADPVNALWFILSYRLGDGRKK